MAIASNLWPTINSSKKLCFPVKKVSSKQGVSMIYTLGKYFFAAATFKGL